MSAITAKASRKMKKYAVLTREPRCFLGSFDFSWEQRKLGDVVKEITRNDPESEAPIMMITANNGFIEQSERYAFNNAGESLKKYILLKKGELAYNHGASKLRPYGSCFALTTAENARIPFVYHCFAAENQNAEFMSIELNGAEIENQLRKIVSSGARMDGLLNISFDEYTSVSVILPGTEEQDRIADFFRHLDNLITLHQRKFEKLTNVKKSMLEKMFPQNGSSYPEIRFKGFTDPWEQRKFSDITFPAGEKNRDNLPLESYSITNEHGFVPQDEKFENGGTMREADKRMYYIVSPNSFAYNPARINVGSIGYQNIGKNVIVSSLYEVFKTSEDVDDRLLWHWFKSPDFQKLIMQLQEGGVRLYFYYDKLCMGEVSLPSLEEQRKIGKLFDTLDNLITLHQRQHFLHSTPDISLSVRLIHPFYTSSWEQRKVSDLAEKTYGGGTPTTSNEAYWNGDIPWIQSSDVVDGKLLGVEPRKWITQDGLNNSAAQLIPGNSIAIITRVGVGKLAFMPYSYATSQDFLSLSKLNAEPLFTVYACYKKLQSELNAVQGTSIKGITKDELLAKNIMVPRYAEQQQIGAFFKQLDNLITLHQRKGKAAVSGCSNDANNSKGVCCKARDFGYKCHKKDEPNRFDA